MRLITWNVARRVEALAAQAAALGGRAPDVVALQEVTARTLPLWEAALPVLGLPAVALQPARRRSRPRAGRRGAAPACCSPPARSSRCRACCRVPWPETALAARVDGTEVHTVHVPNAANGGIKPETLAAVRAGLAGRAGPRILCGDLNTPRREQPDGTVWSFARDSRGRLRDERAGYWDASELGVVPGLRRPRLRRRVPRAPRLRRAVPELDVPADRRARRRLAARPRLRRGPRAGRRPLPPRLARARA